MTDLAAFTPAHIVSLAGVSAEDAYAWGVESGAFMQQVLKNTVEGQHQFHEANLGVILLVAGAKGYDIEVISTCNGWAQCWVHRL